MFSSQEKADHIAVMIQNMKEEASSLLQYVFRSNVPKVEKRFEEGLTTLEERSEESA